MKNILIFLYRTLTSFYLFNSLYSLFISKILKGCGKNLQLTFVTRITGRKNIKIGDDFISMGGAKLYADNGELIPSIEYPYNYFKNNALNSTLLIDLIRRKYKVKKFIYAASSSCYGLSDIKTSENVKINIQHPYAFSKYVGEQAVLHWGKIYKIPTISIRIFNAYGPRSRTTNVYGAVIGVFIKQLITKKPLTIVGDGSQKRDFLYITDLCDAFYKAAISKSKNEIFNLGSGKPQSVMSLAKMIFNKYTYLPWRPGEPKKTHANINKIQIQLKWFPKVSLKRGIKNVLKNIDWWNDAPLWTPSKIKKATKNWHKYLG